MCDLVIYTLPGRPKTWKRAGGRGKRRFNVESHRVGKREHAAAFKEATRGTSWPTAGAFAVGVVGYYPDASTGDLDKLIGMVFDALETHAWGKDRKVRSMLEPTGIVCDGSPERTVVTIKRLAVDPVMGAKARKGGAR